MPQVQTGRMCHLRRIYLIRHGLPEETSGERLCVSRTDPPLSRGGTKQALRLRDWLEEHPVSAIYASPLIRARDTAMTMAAGREVTLCEALMEVDVGEWEGLSFADIRERWPDLYRARGRHLASCAPPGGETFLEAGLRLRRALEGILLQTRGDIAVVSHNGIIRGLLCRLMPVDPDRLMELPQPCGGITALWEDGGALSVASVGHMPTRQPDDWEIRRLHERQGTPENVAAHERAVAETALRLAQDARVEADMPFLRAACLLHDVCRAEGRGHPAAAARLLEREGYPELARVIAVHHDLGVSPSVEAEIVYLADKLMDGTTPVTIEERFERSRKSCLTEEARSRWRERYDTAMMLKERYAKNSEGDMQNEADENAGGRRPDSLS